MTDEEREQYRQRRRLQLATLDSEIGKALVPGQLFLVMLVDGIIGEGGWTLSSNAASPVLIRMLETALAERSGAPVVLDGGAEPTADTVRKLQAQYRKIDVQPTQVIRSQLRAALDAVAQAVLKGDSIGEATLLVYLAGCAMVLYRRSVLSFIETRKSKGGTA